MIGRRHIVTWLTLLLLASLAPDLIWAQAPTDVSDPEPVIEAVQGQPADSAIAQRIQDIFTEIDELSALQASVRNGVVTLTGRVANQAQAARALRLAIRLEGVVTVEDEINRTLDVKDNLKPIVNSFRDDLVGLSRALPLMLFAFVMFLVIAWLANRLASWMTLWRRLAPNPFLAELLSHAVRVAGFVFGLVSALNLVGATALMGTILGGAGVVGIAIGFAVRDSLENYISSVMLSLRQPFRGGDLVKIDDHVGIVVRLTSRATVLMTPDGNHLRIPNAAVFKAVILNYTRNPERRFSFKLGIDGADDPVAAMQVGLDAIRGLEFILNEPKPVAVIEDVGDSNIVIEFRAWVDQSKTDFGKSRSLAIRAAKDVIESEGFTLPEPIYRLRFDGQSPVAATLRTDFSDRSAPSPTPPRKKSGADVAISDDALDVSPDTHLEDKVAEERAEQGETDLLDEAQPVE